MAPIYNVALYIYSQADLIDFSGPLEIYGAGSPNFAPSSFKTTTFSWKSPVKTALTIIPDASFQEISANLHDYDILVVPGAMPDTIKALLKTDEGKQITSLVQKFVTLPPREEQGHRIIQSVCTGSLILAASGILANRTVTTHHMFYDMCKEMADEAAGGEGKSNTNVVNKRWVDAGQSDAGARIVNAGGVTSGFDASLYIVELVAGKEAAEWAAEVVEFEQRRRDDGWGSK